VPEAQTRSCLQVISLERRVQLWRSLFKSQ
jgi:hypothetical protein